MFPCPYPANNYFPVSVQIADKSHSVHQKSVPTFLSPNTNIRNPKLTAFPQLVQIIRISGVKLSLPAVAVPTSGYHRLLLGLINTIVH